MARIAIIGAGDLGQLLAGHIRASSGGTVAGFFDDFATASHPQADSILGRLDDIDQKRDRFDELLVGIGYRHFEKRKQVFERYVKSVPFATFRHPAAWVDPSAVLHPGTVILAGSVIDAGVVLQSNVLINVGSIVSHDSTIGSHSFVAPGVKVAGFVNVGECTFLGIGTTVVDGLNLCPRTRTGAGAVVVKNTLTAGLYVGVPARLREPSS